MTRPTVQEQCSQRREERPILQSLANTFTHKALLRHRRQRDIIKMMVRDVELQCVDKALARLPADATLEMRRQVIREAKDD